MQTSSASSKMSYPPFASFHLQRNLEPPSLLSWPPHFHRHVISAPSGDISASIRSSGYVIKSLIHSLHLHRSPTLPLLRRSTDASSISTQGRVSLMWDAVLASCLY